MIVCNACREPLINYETRLVVPMIAGDAQHFHLACYTPPPKKKPAEHDLDRLPKNAGDL
jgi:hypothetical protein